MALGSIVKIVSAVAGGATAIGTPFLVTRLSSSKEEKILAEEIKVEGKQNCHILVDSKDENKIVVVCRQSAGLNSKVDFFFLKDKSNLKDSQNITSFKRYQFKSSDYSELPFTVSSVTGTAEELIKLSERSGARLSLLSNSKLDTCKLDSFNKKIQISCSATENTSVSIDFITYR